MQWYLSIGGLFSHLFYSILCFFNLIFNFLVSTIAVRCAHTAPGRDRLLWNRYLKCPIRDIIDRLPGQRIYEVQGISCQSHTV